MSSGSPAAAALPGGYALGEKLYFIGPTGPTDNGDRLVHDEQGEVMGPGTDANEGRLLIKFPNNNGNVATIDECLVRRRLLLPGGTLSATRSLMSFRPV